jgi:hypothetical protein
MRYTARMNVFAQRPSRSFTNSNRAFGRRGHRPAAERLRRGPGPLARLPEAARAQRAAPALLHAQGRAAVGQLRADLCKRLAAKAGIRKARPPASPPARLSARLGPERYVAERDPAAPRTPLAAHDERVPPAYRTGGSGRRGDGQDGAPGVAAVGASGRKAARGRRVTSLGLGLRATPRRASSHTHSSARTSRTRDELACGVRLPRRAPSRAPVVPG